MRYSVLPLIPTLGQEAKGWRDSQQLTMEEENPSLRKQSLPYSFSFDEDMETREIAPVSRLEARRSSDSILHQRAARLLLSEERSTDRRTPQPEEETLSEAPEGSITPTSVSRSASLQRRTSPRRHNSVDVMHDHVVVPFKSNHESCPEDDNEDVLSDESSESPGVSPRSSTVLLRRRSSLASPRPLTVKGSHQMMAIILSHSRYREVEACSSIVKSD